MKLNTLVLVGVAAGAGLGIAALMQKKGTIPTLPLPIKPTSPNPTPVLDPSTNPPGTTPSTSTSTTLSNAEDLLKAQQALMVEQQKQADIQRLVSASAAIENDQIITLTKIKAITDDTSKWNDFQQQYMASQIDSGRFSSLVNQCRGAVYSNCGPGLFGMGNCDDDNYPQCEQRSGSLNTLNKGDWNGRTDRNAWLVLTDESKNYADQQVSQWKASQRSPLEAELARLEVQYQGVVRELREKYGVDFQSRNPGIHK